MLKVYQIKPLIYSIRDITLFFTVLQGKVHFVNPDATVATTTRREPSQISKTFATKELMVDIIGTVIYFQRDAIWILVFQVSYLITLFH